MPFNNLAAGSRIALEGGNGSPTMPARKRLAQELVRLKTSWLRCSIAVTRAAIFLFGGSRADTGVCQRAQRDLTYSG